MPRWEFISHARQGPALASLTDLTGRRMSFYLNQPGDLSGTIDLQSPQADRSLVRAGVTELVARREGVPIETRFACVMADPRSDAQGNGQIDLGFLGIMAHLSDLIVGPFTQTASQSAIVDSIVSTAQASANANYGLVPGLHAAGQPSTTFKLEEEMDAREAITLLADRQGFDWSVGIARDVVTYYPRRGGDKTATAVFEHGRNCTIASLPEDASPGALANSVLVKGGDGSFGSAQDLGSQLEYGRREAVVAMTDTIGQPSQLSTVAAQIAALRSQPTTVPEIEVDTLHPAFTFGDPWLGDTIRVVGSIGRTPYRRIDQPFRIVAVHVDVDDQDHETMRLELNPA